MGASISTNKAATPDSTAPENKIDPIPSISMSDSPSHPQSEPQPPSAAAVKPDEAEIGDEEEEEEKGECGFCLFMKGGGCKESFVAWEECIEQAEKANEDIAQKCFDVTSALRTCMLAHPDYYEPILRAEKAAEEEAIKELDKEKAAENTTENKAQEHDVVIELENQKAAAVKAPASLVEKQ